MSANEGTEAPLRLANWGVPCAVLLVIAAGYLAGRGFLPAELFVPSATITSVILAGASFFCKPPEEKNVASRFGATVLLGYILLAVQVEPLASAWTEGHVLFAVAWLVPSILGAVLLPGRALWLVCAAYWLLLFAGVAALTYTVHHIHSGMDFLIMWRS
jgi:hypothetical protein